MGGRGGSTLTSATTPNLSKLVLGLEGEGWGVVVHKSFTIGRESGLKDLQLENNDRHMLFVFYC